MQREPGSTFDIMSPDGVASALQLIEQRLTAAELSVDALKATLVAVVMSAGIERNSPFVTQGSVERALLAAVNSYGNRPEWQHMAEFAADLLAGYRGQLGDEPSKSRSYLKLVPDVGPTTGPEST